MAAITEQQLAEGLEAIYDQWSDNENIDVAEARKQIATEQAKLIAQFVQGRTTTGTGYQGAPVTTTIN
jgi:hypothetical protein